MRRFTSIKFAAALSALAFIVAGCFDGESASTVHEDGSVSDVITISIHDEMLMFAMLSEEEGSQSSIDACNSMIQDVALGWMNNDVATSLGMGIDDQADTVPSTMPEPVVETVNDGSTCAVTRSLVWPAQAVEMITAIDESGFPLTRTSENGWKFTQDFADSDDGEDPAFDFAMIEGLGLDSGLTLPTITVTATLPGIVVDHNADEIAPAVGVGYEGATFTWFLAFEDFPPAEALHAETTPNQMGTGSEMPESVMPSDDMADEMGEEGEAAADDDMTTATTAPTSTAPAVTEARTSTAAPTKKSTTSDDGSYAGWVFVALVILAIVVALVVARVSRRKKNKTAEQSSEPSPDKTAEGTDTDPPAAE